MKLHILLLGMVSILAGCTTEDILAIDGSRHFKVFQVLNNGALAMRCDESLGTRCLGMVVFIPNSVDPESCDVKIIFMEKPKMIDRFTYRTMKDVEKTVPVFIDEPLQ